MSGMRDFIHCAIECVLVCFRWLGKSRKFANKLQRRRPNLVVRRRRTKIVKCFNGSAHKELLIAERVVSKAESRAYQARSLSFFLELLVSLFAGNIIYKRCGLDEKEFGVRESQRWFIQ
jgi:hypothetical protein